MRNGPNWVIFGDIQNKQSVFQIIMRGPYKRPAVSFQAHRLFCVRAESKFGRDANLSTDEQLCGFVDRGSGRQMLLGFLPPAGRDVVESVSGFFQYLFPPWR